MTDEIRALTIRQPWANLIATRAKTIETRSWSTDWRGTLLIHAGKAKPDPHLFRLYGVGANPVRWSLGLMPSDPVPDLPLGAVVAAARLADVVPIVEHDDRDVRGARVAEYVHEGDLPHQRGGLWLTGPTGLGHGSPTRIEDERSLGDFTPGRFAWLLTDVRPIDPVPAKGRQGLWKPDADLIGACS